MSETLEKAGMPINKISDVEIIFDVGALHSLNYGSTRSGKNEKTFSNFCHVNCQSKRISSLS